MYLDSNLHNSSLFFIHKVRFNEQKLTKRSFCGWKWTLVIKVWRSLMPSLHQPSTYLKICFTRKHFKSQISFVCFSALQSTLWILSFHWASALDKFGKPASQRITVQIEVYFMFLEQATWKTVLWSTWIRIHKTHIKIFGLQREGFSQFRILKRWEYVDKYALHL